MILSDLPDRTVSCPSGRKHGPRKMRGFCIVRPFNEQRVLFRLRFPYRLDPSQDHQTAYNAGRHLATLTALALAVRVGFLGCSGAASGVENLSQQVAAAIPRRAR